MKRFVLIILLTLCFTGNALVSEAKGDFIKESFFLGFGGIFSLLTHETGHMISASMVGANNIKYKGLSVEFDNIKRDQYAFVSVGSIVLQEVAFNQICYLNQDFQMSRAVKYWATISYLDFSVQAIQQYFDDKSDFSIFQRATGFPREALTVLGAAHLLFYYPTIKALWKNMPYKSPLLQLKLGSKKVMLYKEWKF